MSRSESGGRVAVITGAGQGIGRAIALRLAADGLTVVVVDVDEASARETVQLVERGGGHARVRAVDLADRAARDEVVGSVLGELGRVDVLVNNAAYTGRRLPFTAVDYDEWDRIFETNVAATAFLARAAGAHMMARGSGAIVNTVSVQARLPVATYAAYVASKGAIGALTKALAVEMSPYGVRVNAVEPGVIGTASFRETLDDAGQGGDEAGPRAATLFGRTGHPGEVAGVVSFLAGEDASFVTGAIVPVDGGRHLSRRPDPFEIAFRESPIPGRV